MWGQMAQLLQQTLGPASPCHVAAGRQASRVQGPPWGPSPEGLRGDSSVQGVTSSVLPAWCAHSLQVLNTRRMWTGHRVASCGL